MEATIAALRAQMATADYGRDDPIRATMALVGDSWTPLILLVLDTGEWRHADLRRALGQLAGDRPISQRVLSLKLRTLEREGYVVRPPPGMFPLGSAMRSPRWGANCTSWRARGCNGSPTGARRLRGPATCSTGRAERPGQAR